MSWSDKSVSPVVWTPASGDAANMTLTSYASVRTGVLGPAAMLVKLIPPVFELHFVNYVVGGAGVPDTWPDTTGTTRATQSTDSRKPTKTETGLQFSEGKALVLSANPQLTSTIVLCLRLDKWTTNSFSYLLSGADGNFFGYDWNDGGPRILGGGFSGYATNNFRLELWGKYIVMSIRQKATTPFFEIRMGGILTTYATGPSADCRVLRTYLGAKDAIGTRALNGSIQSYIEFGSYLSDSDLLLAENALRERYGAV